MSEGDEFQFIFSNRFLHELGRVSGNVGIALRLCALERKSEWNLVFLFMPGLEPLPKDQLRLAAAEAELYRNTDPAEIYVEESYRLVDL